MPLNPVLSHGTNRNIKNIVIKKNGIVTLSSFYLVNVAVFLWPHAKGISEQFGKVTCISIAHFESHGTDTIIRILKKQQSVVHSHDLEIFIGCRSIHLSKSHLETGRTHICGLSQFGDRRVSRQIPLHQRNSLSERSLILFMLIPAVLGIALPMAMMRRYIQDDFTEQLMVENFIDTVQNEKLAYGLRHLTDRQRYAIELAFWEGYQYKEIAVILDCSPAAVTLLLQRAFHRLRSFLAE